MNIWKIRKIKLRKFNISYKCLKRWRSALINVPFIYVVKELYTIIGENRNLVMLRSRTMIWEAFIGHI